ncbi:MAG TPA: carboxypeptidase-like regulatory domain-containing protein [Gemmatimonadaceae bacterium]|nr:carboxypeptidase-like regulatory domain-containing protein [Gemmatimonadaceae bacterium]
MAGLATLHAAAGAAAVQAQSGAIRGTVRDSAGTPVRSAQVQVGSINRVAFVDSAGRFALTDLKEGTYALLVRRIGWEPRTERVRVGPGEQVSLDIVLRRLPQALETVVVRADTICPRFTYAGVLCRRAEGRGFMMDADEIAAKRPHLLAWVFLDVPGMTVEAVQGGIVPKSRRGWRCLKSVVNGREWRWSEPPSLQNIQAIEVFHPEEIPPEYAHYAWGTYGTRRFPMNVRCTLIVYWTTGPRDG